MFDDPAAIVEYELSRNEPEPNPNGCGGCGCLSLKLFLMFLLGVILFCLILEIFSFIA